MQQTQGQETNEDLRAKGSTAHAPTQEMDTLEKMWEERIQQEVERYQGGKKYSCCFIFKLESGVLTMVFVDLILLLFVLCTAGVNIDGNRAAVSTGDFTGGHIYKQAKKSKSFLLFDMVTDWVLIVLFLIKFSYAVNYGLSQQYRGKKDDEFLIAENGDRLWKTRVLCRQRKNLQNYLQATTVFQRFEMILGFTLLWIFSERNVIMIKIFVLLCHSFILKQYLIPKMKQTIESNNNYIRACYLTMDEHREEGVRNQKVVRKGKNQQPGNRINFMKRQLSDLRDSAISRDSQSFISGSDNKSNVGQTGTYENTRRHSGTFGDGPSLYNSFQPASTMPGSYQDIKM